MNLRRTLNQVGGEETPSVTRAILTAYTSGELELKDFMTHNASWVCENLNQYQPRLYPRMPDQVRDYVRGRLTGNRDCEPSLSQKLGAWTHLAVQIREQNDADVMLILWAAEKCALVRLERQARAGTDAAERLMKIQFPIEVFSEAIRAQALDSNAKINLQRAAR